MVHRQCARVIVNPNAGGGTTGRKWPRIRECLLRLGPSFDSTHTSCRGHARELAREAAGAGYGLVVGVGGDGTLNEIANGLIDAGAAADVMLGALHTGTGGDFIRSLGIPRDWHQACVRLASPVKTLIDVGVVDYRHEGHPARRAFLNAAGLGFDGEVVRALGGMTRVGRGTFPYLLALLRSLATYRNKGIRLQIDGGGSDDLRICSVVVANGGFFGGGMHVAPGADLRDGLFEVMVVGDIGKLELLRAFPRVYRGTHVTHARIRMDRAARVAIECDDHLLIQADGELLGVAPASFGMLPAAVAVAL